MGSTSKHMYREVQIKHIPLHYMTDGHERFDLKISKLKILLKKTHLHLGCT